MCWLLATLAAMLALAPTFALITDVRYSFGTIRAAADGGLNAGEIFNHRPIMNRILMAILDIPTVGTIAQKETETMVIAVAVVSAAAWFLQHRLTPYLGRAEAVGLSAATGLALAWSSTLDFLQPEWVAVVLAMLAVAVALHPGEDTWRRLIGVGLTSGTLLALVALMKYTTISTAAIAWGVILVLDRRRALTSAIAAALLAPAFFGLGMVLQPHEWQWFKDLRSFNKPVSQIRWIFFWRSLLNEPMLAPVLVMLVPVQVLMARLSRGWRRAAWLGLPWLGIAGVMATYILQAAWYQYHLSVLPPMVAGMWGFAVMRAHRLLHRVPWAAVIPAVIAAVGCAIMQSTSEPYRENDQSTAIWLLSVAGALGVLLALAPSRRRDQPQHDQPQHDQSQHDQSQHDQRGRWQVALAALVGAATLAVSILPWAHVEYLYSEGSSWTRENRLGYRERRLAETTVIHERIGAHTPIVYLAFGPRVYLVGNPTHCRYPAAVILQRSGTLPSIVDTPSFAENLACLDDTSSPYVLVDQGWMRMSRVDASVRAALERNYNCDEPVYGTVGVVVCPRR